jgi:outer membrane protein
MGCYKPGCVFGFDVYFRLYHFLGGLLPIMNFSSKQLLHTVSAAALLAVITMANSIPVALADTIGYVNVDKVLGSYDKYQSVLADIKVREADLRKMQADFVKQLETNRKANAKSPVTADAMEKGLRDKLQARFNEDRDWATTKQKEIDTAVNGTIKQVAMQKGVDVVVNEQALLLGGVDLTNEVVSALNKGGAGMGSAPVKPMAKPAK